MELGSQQKPMAGFWADILGSLIFKELPAR
jgi:hypothetical protein